MRKHETDMHTTQLERPYASAQDHAYAYAYLQRRHARGTLPPIVDWPGDIVAGYAAILGIKP